MYSKVLKKYNPYTDEQTMRIYGQLHSYHEERLGGDWYWWARIEEGKVVAIGEENGAHCGGEHEIVNIRRGQVVGKIETVAYNQNFHGYPFLTSIWRYT